MPHKKINDKSLKNRLKDGRVYVDTAVAVAGVFAAIGGACVVKAQNSQAEIVRENPQMSKDEAKMFFYAQRGASGLLKKHLKEHGDLDINTPDRDGNTIFMKVLSATDPITIRMLLDEYGDKIDYNHRNNAGEGYQDILKDIEKRLKSRRPDPVDEGFFNMITKQINENAAKQKQEEAAGKVRSNTSYALFEMTQNRTR